MNWTPEQFEEICSAYCMGALSPDERQAFEAALEHATPEQKAAFQQMLFAAQHMPLSAPLESPSPEVKERLMAAVSPVQEFESTVTSFKTAPPKSKWADALRGFRFKSSKLSQLNLFENIYRKLHFDRPVVAVSVPATLVLICVYLFLEQSEMRGTIDESKQKLSAQQNTVSTQTQELNGLRAKMAEMEQKVAQDTQKITDLESKSTEIQSKMAGKEKELADIKVAGEQNKEFLELMNSVDLKVTEIKGLKPHPQGSGKIFYNPKTKMAYIHVANLPPAPQNKDYELWMMEGGKPVAAGVFQIRPDKTALAKVTTGMVVEPHRLSAFAVTLEPKGGVKSPTGPMYLKGTVKL